MWNGTLRPLSKCGPTVLLDFDGVVFINKKVGRHVIDRSIEWVSNTMDIPKKDAVLLNNLTYKTRGHTSMIQGGSIDLGTEEELLRSYNDFVFDDYLLDKLIPSCLDHKDTSHIDNLISIANNRGLGFVLCTNAPKRYCDRVLSLQGFAFSDLFREDVVFSSDIAQSVKPMPEFYSFVNESFVEESTIHFLDDSTVNVVGANVYTNWCPILVSNRKDIYEHLARFPINKQYANIYM